MKTYFKSQYLLSTLAALMLCFAGISQNAIVGNGFSSGWGGSSCPTGNTNFTFFSAGAGNSYIATLTSGATGIRNWRFGIDWSTTTAQRTNTIGSDITVSPSTQYSLNATCTTSGSLQYDVPSTSHNYIFKTADAGTNPSGAWTFFEVQGTVRTVSSASISPSTVAPGLAVTVTANMSGTQTTGQNVYLRYSTASDFSTSTVVSMAYSSSTATGTIPAAINTPGAIIYYYIFTSGPSNVASNGSNSDLFTINRLPASGSSNYTVSAGWTTAATGPWTTAGTWTANAVPPTALSLGSVTIAHNVTSFGANALASSITISATGTLVASANTLTISNNSNVTTFTNTGTYTASGTHLVAFTGTGTHTISGTQTFQNVTTSTGVNFGASSTISTSGTFQINAGGFASTNAPTYATGSSLIYNAGGTYTAGTEWTSNALTGQGVPSNVTIGNGVNTTLSFGAANLYRQARGNVSVSASSGLTLSSASGGDIRIGGNFTNNGTYTHSTRAITFNGTAAQTVSGTLSNGTAATNILTFVTVDNTAADVTFSSNTNIGGSLAVTGSSRLNIGTTTMVINSTVIATINGFLRSAGTVTTTGTLVVGATGMYEHNHLQASASNLGTIPTATWNTGSTCAIIGLTSPNSGVWFSAGAAQTFNNFTWNTPALTTNPNMAGATLTCTGTFTMTSTNSGELRFGGSSSGTVTCLNFTQTGGTINLASGTGTGTINCSGTFNQSAGTIDESSSGSGIIILNAASGNQNITASGSITNVVSWRIGTGSSTNTGTMLSNIALGIAGATVTVRAGSGLIFGTNQITGLGAFVAESNSSLTSANLIASGAFNTGGVNGSVINTGSKTFTNTGVNYSFNGASAQFTGNAIGAATDIRNLTINNSSGVTLSAATNLSSTGVLTFTSGNLTLGANNITLTSGATISGATSARYVVTDNTGRLIQTVASTSVTFPIGNSAFNPISFGNTGTSDTYAIRVIDGVIGTANDATKTINRLWSVTEGTAGTSVITPAITYNSAEINNATAWAAGTQPVMCIFPSAWSQLNATASGSGPFVFTATASFSPSAATYSFGLAKDDGLVGVAAPPTIAGTGGVAASSPGSGLSGYVGNTITITGTNLATVTIARVGGSGGTTVSIVSQTSTTLTFAAINLGGQIYVENPAGNTTSAETYINLGFISTNTGNWNTGSVWLGGAVPAANSIVTMAHNVNIPVAITNTPISSLTINTGITANLNATVAALTVTNALTTSGTGIFTLTGASGAATVGSVTNAGTLSWTNTSTLNISAAGTLTNNGTFTGGTGTVSFAGAGTVSGSNAITFSNLVINTGALTLTTVPTINGVFTINGGNVSAAPIYTSSSTLFYNATYNRFNEWNATGVGTIGTTAGYPNNVTINTGTFTVVNADAGTARALNGALLVNTGTTFTTGALNANFTIGGNMTTSGTGAITMSSTNQSMFVGGAVNIATTGALTLSSSSGGDLYVSGNFANSGTFTHNTRAVFFNGTTATAQTISGSSLNSNGSTNCFAYLVNNTSGTGGITIGTSVTIDGTTGDVLQMLNAGPLNIGAFILTINGAGGNIRVTGGTRVINFTSASGVLRVIGTGSLAKTVASTSAGLLSITSSPANGQVQIQNGGLDFGSSLSTIQTGVFLVINSGGYVATNSATYASGSTLSFRNGAAYGVGSGDRTWASGTSGAGVPWNVEVNLASTNVQINEARTITNNLTITLGTLTNNTNTLTIGPGGGGNKVLTVNGGRLTNNGGTINHNGNVVISSGFFDMSSGNFNIDPNDGVSGTSVASGTDVFTISSAVNSTGVTGGTILFNDPPFEGTGRTFSYTAGSGNSNWTGNTMQFGGSSGTHSSTATNGFNVDTYVGTSNIQLGNVIANGGTGTSRFVSGSATSTNGFDIGGNLTINTNSEVRVLSSGTVLRIRGNIVNNGTLTSLAGIAFNNRTGATVNANTVAQTVSGSGTFQNALSSPTAKYSALTFNNTAASSAITFSIGEVSVSSSVDFAAGRINIGSANDWVFVGTASSSGTSGYLVRDATAAGFMKRTHPGTGSFTYRIGDGTIYSPITLNFSVNSVSRQMGVSVSDTKHPDMDTPIAAVDYHSRYWRLYESASGGNYTFTAAMTYDVSGDVNGTESAIRAAGWNGTAWTGFLTGTVSSPTLTSGSITQVNAPTLNDLVVTGRLNPADVTPPTIGTFTAIPSSCVTGNVTISGVNITDVTGLPSSPSLAASTLRPRIYYRKNSGTWFSNAATYSSGTATNSTWDFTVVATDMSGLTGGDIIQYYLIAQDDASTGVNIRSAPTGVTATDVNTITTHPSSPNSYSVYYTLSGNYNVGSASSAPFNNLVNAIATYNNACLSGAVTFSLTDASYTPASVLTVNSNVDASATNTFTIKPTLSGTTISATFATAIFVLNGADYVIIDGSTGSTANTVCPVSSASRNLTITNSSTSGSSAVIWLQTATGPNAASNNTVRNCNVVGNSTTTTFAGIGSGNTTIGFTSAGTSNNNNSFINNDVKRAVVGLFSRGASAGNKNSGNIIQQNSITGGSPDNIYRAAVYVGFENNITISGNDIANVNVNAAGSIDGFGISLGSNNIASGSYTGDEVTNATITNNKINLVRGGSGNSVAGIFVPTTSAGTTLIANNMIGNVLTNGSSGEFGAGIFIGGGSATTNVYYNTVYSNTSTTFNNTGRVYGLAVGGSNPVVNVNNNIFNITIGTLTSGVPTRAIGLDYATYTNLNSNNNSFFVSGGNSTTVAIAQVTALSASGTNVVTLANWQSTTSDDASSINQQAVVTSTTDLHLTVSSVSNLSFNGTGTVVSVTTDIDCDNRTGTDSPDIGADEYSIPTCSGTPEAGTAVASPVGPFCGSATTSLSISGYSLAYGITYQWQQSATGGFGTFVNIPSAVATVFGISGLGATNNYRCIVTCTNSALTDSTNVLGITVNPSPSVVVSPTSALICGSGSVALTASGASTYAWSPSAGLSAITGASVTATPTVSTAYVVTGTNAFGCTATATSVISYSPAIPTITPTGTPDPSCQGGTVNLGVGVSNTTLTVYEERFNDPTNSWTRTNTSTSGVDPLLAAWTLRPSGYVYSSNTFTTSDVSQFYLSNSDEQGTGGTTATILTSPAFSTTGISTANVNLSHHFRDNDTETGAVEASTDGITWTTLQTYTSTQGSSGSFATPSINMNAFANQPVVFIRFKYDATFDWYWAINNVSVSGNAIYTYNWTSTPSGFTSTVQNPTHSPDVSTTYNLTVSNIVGCTGSGNRSVVVTPAAIVDAGSSMTTCGTTPFLFNSGANTLNTTGISWTTTGGGTFTSTTTLTPTYTPLTGEAGTTITFTLTGTASSPCSSVADNVTLAVQVLNLYYPDADGDGYGNVFGSPISGCTTPSGYANNNQDPCDTNGNVNPMTEWWADLDGDGFGSFVYITGIVSGCSGFAQTIPYFPGVNGNLPYAADCNDNSVTVYPGAPEICQNGIDEDCDGTVDDGCSFISNDNRVNALNMSFNPFPQCVQINGTCLNAAISPEGNTANVAAGGGRDVWYKFTAPSRGVTIRVIPSGFNAVLELQNAAGTELNVENLTASGVHEILNFGNLTAGQIYFVAVRNFANTAGGTFTICVAPLMSSSCAANGSAVQLCTNYKPAFTGASNYTFTFTGTGATPVGPTIGTAASQIALSSNVLALRYGGSYRAKINANYALLNGLGATENITISATDSCSFTINAHASVEVKSTQRCPATVLRGSTLQAKPFVCGTLNFTVSFRRVNNCTGSSYLDPAAFEVTTGGASSVLGLGFTSPQSLTPQNWYEVRWRPNFSYGSGTYGTARYIFIGGSVLDEIIDLEQNSSAEKMEEMEILANIYPNPNNGEFVNLNMTGIKGNEVFVRIIDSMGKVVFSHLYAVAGSLNRIATFTKPLSGGLYIVEFTTDTEVVSERMIVER